MYSGSQYHSWHGTSVQVVQPQQRLKNILLPPEASSLSLSSCTSAMQHLNDRCRLRTSPISSPSKYGRSPSNKRIKRARTFTLSDEVSELKKGITGEILWYRELWRISCEQERDDMRERERESVRWKYLRHVPF